MMSLLGGEQLLQQRGERGKQEPVGPTRQNLGRGKADLSAAGLRAKVVIRKGCVRKWGKRANVFSCKPLLSNFGLLFLHSLVTQGDKVP